MGVFWMRLSELKSEIQKFAKSPYVDRLYPITSDWVPITDILVIVDRFERQLRDQLESAQKKDKSTLREGDNTLLEETLDELLS